MKMLVAFGLLIAALHSCAEPLTFMVTGDGRAAPVARPQDVDGYNAEILKETIQAAKDEHVKFVMYSGDLVLGSTKADVFHKMLTSWMTVAKPLWEAGIPVYAVRGNHEWNSGDCMTTWNEVFKGSYEMPQNGPEGEKNVTWSKAIGNVLIVGLDQASGHPHEVNQKWLDEQLADPKRPPHVFVMGHEMAFKAGLHKDCLDANIAARDAFWVSLRDHGAKVFFAGHDHLYDHMSVAGGPGTSSEMHQFVAGGAGAPFYTGSTYDGANSSFKLTPIKHVENAYGYLIVTVEGKNVKIVHKSRREPGKYVEDDTYAY